MYSIYTGLQAIYAPSGVGSSYLVIHPRYQHEVNKAGQISFVLPPENEMFGKLKQLVTPISLYQDSREIFFGRIVSVERDFYNHELITIEGALAFLHDAVIRPFSVRFTGPDAVRKYIIYILRQYNEQVVDEWKQIHVGRITVTDPNDVVYRWKDSYNDAYEVLMDHTIETSLGGYLSIRRANGRTFLDYSPNAGETSDQVIQFGENLLDINRYINAEHVFTVMLPLGKEGKNSRKITVAPVNGQKDYIESAEGISLFGRIWKVIEYPDITSAKALLTAAKKDIKTAFLEAVSIDIKAVDLSLINHNIGGLRHGTIVRVISKPHGIDEYMLCRKVDLNLNEPDDAVYTLGAEATTLSGQYAQIQRGIVLAADAADSAAIDAIMAQQTAQEAMDIITAPDIPTDDSDGGDPSDDDINPVE